MENNSQHARRPGYGPAPTQGGYGLSPSRAALLATLRTQTEPTTLAALVTRSGLHPNTVREHLDALVEMGLVERHSGAPNGRGRPPHLFQASTREAGPSSEYAGLAAALASTIHRASQTPTEDAAQAGVEWGRDLAATRGATPRRSGIAARREVVALLDEVGFAPETDARAEVVQLTGCPLLEAAHRYPEIVCAVHRGLTQGALEAYGGDPEEVELFPFAQPGSCRLELARRT